MDTAIIVGIDTLVGANIAATLADRFQVIGISPRSAITIEGCRTVVDSGGTARTLANQWAAEEPAWIIYCGLSNSSWDDQPSRPLTKVAHTAVEWARTAEKLNTRFTLISTDAVFTGPWIFHREDCDTFCDSSEATIVREAESRCVQACQQTLVVRTNAFGWSPEGTGEGFIERTLSALETGSADHFDSVRHATPMLASDLAEVIVQAYHDQLSGVCHISGGERINPSQFASRLAAQFEVPAPLPRVVGILSDRPIGFGCGETSLLSGKARSALGFTPPLLEESLQRLADQSENGYRDRLRGGAHTHGKVA